MFYIWLFFSFFSFLKLKLRTTWSFTLQNKGEGEEEELKNKELSPSAALQGGGHTHARAHARTHSHIHSSKRRILRKILKNKASLSDFDTHEVIEQVAHEAGVWFHWFTCTFIEWAAAIHLEKKKKKKPNMTETPFWCIIWRSGFKIESGGKRRQARWQTKVCDWSKMFLFWAKCLRRFFFFSHKSRWCSSPVTSTYFLFLSKRKYCCNREQHVNRLQILHLELHFLKKSNLAERGQGNELREVFFFG